MKKKILTITYNDLSISWGPAVHYLELWNEFYYCCNDKYIVEGIAPYWQSSKTIIKPNFKLTTWFVTKIPLVRQIIFDFFCFLR